MHSAPEEHGSSLIGLRQDASGIRHLAWLFLHGLVLWASVLALRAEPPASAAGERVGDDTTLAVIVGVS
jgi:hypothetical protein